MEHIIIPILEQVEKEIAETGVLSFPRSGLTRPEAIHFQSTLEAGGVVCRILPPLMEQ